MLILFQTFKIGGIMKTYKILLLLFSLLGFSSSVHPQWIQTLGLTGKEVTCLAVSGPKLFAGTMDGVFLMNTKRESWKAVNNGLAHDSVTSLVVCEPNLYAGTLGGGVFRSIDKGKNWTSLYNGMKGFSVSSIASMGSTIFAGIDANFPNRGASIFRSTDNGLNWQLVDTDLNHATISCIAVHDTTVFAGIVLYDEASVILRSLNNGTSWDNSIDGFRRYFTCLLFKDSTVFAGDDGMHGVLSRSTDNGKNWTELRNGLTNTYVISLTNWKTSLFAGTYNGVYQSDDNGDSWTHIGLDSTKVTALAIRGTDLYAGTSNGVWLRSLTEIITSTENPAGLPVKATLDQNYPNPFTDHTSLHFSLAKKGFVTIKIYDLTSQLVCELVNGIYPSGISTIDWNGTDSNGKKVNTGIYTCRMTVENQSKTIKMVVF